MAFLLKPVLIVTQGFGIRGNKKNRSENQSGFKIVLVFTIEQQQYQQQEQYQQQQNQ
jgi:hypothetical protein